MSLRAMTNEDAKLAKAFVEKYGKTARLKDLNEFKDAHKVGVSYILARATKVDRGQWDFTKALEAAEAVLKGDADPSAPAPKAKAVKVAKPKAEKKAKAPKAKVVKAKAKTVKATKAKVDVTVTPAVKPATVDELIAKIDSIDKAAAAKTDANEAV